jgi:multiple sugar transport system permease protein
VSHLLVAEEGSLRRLWDQIEIPRPLSSRMPSGMRRLLSRFSPYLMLAPAVLLLLSVSVYPIYYSIRVSLERRTGPGVAQFIGLQNYSQLLSDAEFWSSLKITALYTVVVVAVELLLGLGLALLVQPLAGRVARALRVTFVLPMVIAPIVAGVIWRILYESQTGPVSYLASQLGLGHVDVLNSSSTALGGVMLVDIWEWTPFMFLMLLAGLQSLPVEPYEAARVDGAGRLRVFFTITLPMLRPVLLVALIFRSIDAFGVFDQVYVVTGGGPGTATNVVSKYAYDVAFGNNQLGYAATITFAMILVLAIVVGALVLRLRRSRRWL